MIKIIIPGEPCALQRHRTTIVAGKQKQYDPQAKKKMTTRNIMLVQRNTSKWPYNGRNDDIGQIQGFDLAISYYCYRPPSMRDLSEEKLNLVHHTRKPDIDNLDKYIFDCGNSILWHDDAEIYKCTSQKFWSKTPRTEISIND